MVPAAAARVAGRGLSTDGSHRRDWTAGPARGTRAPMLDTPIRRRIDPALLALARRLSDVGATPNGVTLAAFAVGLLAAWAIAERWFLVGLALILLSRLGDGLDGGVARVSGRQSDFGGYLDIVLDFAFYGAIPFAFALADPAANAVPAAFLVLTFYVNGASFLAYAQMAEKRGAPERGTKSLLYTVGLAEATETIVVFAAMCLFPGWFAWLAWGFGAVVIYTAFSRIMLAREAFGD